MVKKPAITSLKELQNRKKELRLETELTKRHLAHSMGSSRENLSNYLVKRVALPVGGVSLALFSLNKLLSSSGRQPEIVRETKVVHEYPPEYREQLAAARATPPPRSKSKMFKYALSIGRLIIPIVQAIIGAINSHQAKEHAKEAEQAAQRS